MPYSDFGLAISMDTFWNLWNDVKTYINDIIKSGAKILKLKNNYQDIAQRAEAIGWNDLAAEARSRMSYMDQLFAIWQSVQAQIGKYWDYFMGAEESGVSGFGIAFIIPLAILAGIITALVMISTQGRKLLDNIRTEDRIFQDLENKVINAEEAAGLIRAAKGGAPDIIERIESTIGSIGTIGIISVAGYITYKYILPMFSGRRRR